MTVNPPAGYLPPPSPGDKPERPSTVSIASLLLYGVAALALLGVVFQVMSMSSISKERITDIYREAGADQTTAEASATAYQLSTYVAVGFVALIAALLVILAVFVGKGKQWARITTWVVGGIFLCCTGVGLGFAASGFTGGNAGGIDAAKVTELMEAELPSWVTPVGTVLSVIQLLATLGAIILLALPPSHAFFRKPQAEWVPPTYPTA